MLTRMDTHQPPDSPGQRSVLELDPVQLSPHSCKQRIIDTDQIHQNILVPPQERQNQLNFTIKSIKFIYMVQNHFNAAYETKMCFSPF